MTNITLRAFSAEVTYYICLSWRIEKSNRPFPKLYYFNLKIRPNLGISTLFINLVAWIEGVFLKAFPGRINMFRDSQTLILMFAALKKLNNFIYCNNIYCPHRILFHFQALKIVKQNEERKQNAVGCNNWKKWGINGINYVENGRPWSELSQFNALTLV